MPRERVVRAVELDVPARLAGALIQLAARGGRDPFVGTAVHDEQRPRRYRRDNVSWPPSAGLELLQAQLSLRPGAQPGGPPVPRFGIRLLRAQTGPSPLGQ